MKKIKAWAIVNTNGNIPCEGGNYDVFYGDGDADEALVAERQLGRSVSRYKIIPCTISYSAPRTKAKRTATK